MAAEPRDAATLILLRDTAGREEVEVLMVRRHVRSDFAADTNVFPGGSVEEGDLAEEETREAGPGEAGRTGYPGAGGRRFPGDKALRLAAIRETFEETGILLARRRGGATPFMPGLEASLISSVREDLRGGKVGFVQALTAHGLEPAVEALVPFARWITPEAMPVRFDARFLLAEAPAGQEPFLDGEEISGCLWISPREALRRCREGLFPMLPPTVANLRELAAFRTVTEALEGARRKEVRAVMPRLVTSGGKVRLLFPGDPGYEE